jgi:hypothetical protein
VTINNSYLVGLFSSASSSSSSASNLFSALYPSTSTSSSGSSSSNTSALAQSGATAASSYVPPTPPWNQGSPQTSTLVQNAINGQSFVNPNAAQLDVTDSTASVNADYKKLFAVYQGLNTLSALVTQAQATDNGNIETEQIKSAFSTGLSQISSYLQTNPFTNLSLVQGSVSTSQTTRVETPQGSTTYVGDNIVSGSSATAAPAFAGDVQFSATIQKTKTQATTVNGVLTESSVPDGSPVTVNFNLADMGTQTRSLTNVVNYLNSQLAAAGVSTRFATQRTAGATQTISVGGQTVDLSTTPDQFALVVKGSPTENVSFSAPATSDAVYVNQAVGAPDTATQQLAKYQTDTSTGTAAPAAVAQPSATYVTNGEALQTAPPSGVNSVLASATAPDGSLYEVANVDAQTVSGQPIKGQTDVALLKYDSSGHLLFTQTLGADANAQGYGIAVSPDGSSVAVTGSVTGGLLPDGTTAASGTGASNSTTGSTTPASFVSVYDSSGDPQWTQVTPSASGDQANAVTFGADGSVYVAGQTQSALPGAGGSEGGTDGYIQGFTSTGTQTFLQEYGTSGTDTPAGIAVVGNTLLVAGTENGDGVVRNYQLQSSGAPVLTAKRDLGALGDGGIAGLAINNGQVIVAGTTTNPNLSAGTITAAAGTGSNAFVASLSTSLTPTSSDALAYYPGQGQTKATAVSVADGQVYIAGNTGPTIATTDTPPVTTSTSSTTTTPTYATNAQGFITGQGGFLAQIDPTTGTVGWSTALTGVQGIVDPTSIAASTGGASVLDRLGLPTGAISQTASDLLTNSTSVVAGDSFYVQTVAGASPTKITISPDETWTSLAAKIQSAANGFATVTALPDSTSGNLTIKASGTINTVQLLSGPNGSDALAALGLEPGLIQPADATSSSSTSKTPLVYGISLPSDLDLNSTADIANASAQISASLSLLKSAYQGLVNANTPATPATPSGSSGTVPAYLSAQLANYQAGLARLG